MRMPSSSGVRTGVDYVIPTTGYYDFRVAGTQGGPSGHVGGLGAIVGGELFFDAGDTLGLIVGGGGYVGIPIEGYAGSGGGGSFVFGGSGLLFAAGGGAGDNFGSALGNPGIGTGPHPGGFGSSGSYGGRRGVRRSHSTRAPRKSSPSSAAGSGRILPQWRCRCVLLFRGWTDGRVRRRRGRRI